MSATPLHDPWVTAAEMCEMRGISERRAYKERAAGKGPDFFQDMPRGHVRYRLSDVVRYMERNTRKPRAKAAR